MIILNKTEFISWLEEWGDEDLNIHQIVEEIEMSEEFPSTYFLINTEQQERFSFELELATQEELDAEKEHAMDILKWKEEAGIRGVF